MSGTVKIPGVGPVKKEYAIGGGVIVVAIVGMAYLRRKKAAAAAPADTTGTAIPDATTYSAATDGAGYQPYGGGGNYGAAAYSQYGYDLYGNPLPAPTGLGTTGVYTTNNEWAIAAESALENSMTLTVASTAITRVLGGLSVDHTQQGIFMQAVGLLGQPPQGYPKPIHVVDTPGHPKPPAPSGTPHKPAGLHVTHVTRTSVSLDWAPVKNTHVSGYHVYRGGALLTTVTYSQYAVQGLHPGTHYTFEVAAIAATGGKVGPKASISVSTHK